MQDVLMDNFAILKKQQKLSLKQQKLPLFGLFYELHVPFFYTSEAWKQIQRVVLWGSNTWDVLCSLWGEHRAGEKYFLLWVLDHLTVLEHHPLKYFTASNRPGSLFIYHNCQIVVQPGMHYYAVSLQRGIIRWTAKQLQNVPKKHVGCILTDSNWPSPTFNNIHYYIVFIKK